MTNRTLAIIKPDAVKRNLIGKIINIIEENDFVINQLKSYHLNAVEAETFYEIHKGKSFFNSLNILYVLSLLLPSTKIISNLLCIFLNLFKA